MSNGVMSEVMSAEALVPSKKLSARGWMRANLFNRWYNALLTLILALVIAYLGFRSIRYLFWTAEWEPVRANLTLFMIGSFPRDEQWRVVVQQMV